MLSNILIKGFLLEDQYRAKGFSYFWGGTLILSSVLTVLDAQNTLAETITLLVRNIPPWFDVVHILYHSFLMLPIKDPRGPTALSNTMAENEVALDRNIIPCIKIKYFLIRPFFLSHHGSAMLPNILGDCPTPREGHSLMGRSRGYLVLSSASFSSLKIWRPIPLQITKREYCISKEGASLQRSRSRTFSFLSPFSSLPSSAPPLRKHIKKNDTLTFILAGYVATLPH